MKLSGWLSGALYAAMRESFNFPVVACEAPTLLIQSDSSN
jgi:putative lipase involved disintegration of autophagic bodies